MTEDTHQPNPPKLRLVRMPEEAEAAPAREESLSPDALNPDLKLEESAVAPAVAPAEAPAVEKADAPAEAPAVKKADAPVLKTLVPDPPIKLKDQGAGPAVSDQSPPVLPNNPASVASDATTGKLEKVSDYTGEDKQDGEKILSFIVILVLFGLLGLCGFGIYFVMKTPEDAPVKQAETVDSAATSGPIAKTKAVVSSIPDSVSELLSETDSATISQTESAAPSNPAATLPSVSEAPAPLNSETVLRLDSTTQKSDNSDSDTELESVMLAPPSENLGQIPSNPDPAPAPDPAPEVSPISTPNITPTIETDTGLSLAVSEYLTRAHVGGVRTGDRPKLILNGESYQPGDIVDPTSNLRFIGLRDGKLAFQDSQGTIYIKSF